MSAVSGVIAPETADKGAIGAERVRWARDRVRGRGSAAGSRVREMGVSRVANVTQNAGALLASVWPLV